MDTTKISSDVFDFRLTVPSRILLCANSGSGKTHLILDLIRKRDVVFSEKFTKVYYIYCSAQKAFLDFKAENPEVEFLTEVPEIKQNNTDHTLLIFDDFLLSHETTGNKLITEYFIRLSHHLNITVVCSWQTLFPKQLKTVSNNANYLIIFPFKRDISSLDILNRQMLPDDSHFLRTVMKDIGKTQYSFLLIDNFQANDNFRFRNFVYPTVNSKIYLPIAQANSFPKEFLKKIE